MYGSHDLHGSFILKLYDLTFYYFILFIILSISSSILFPYYLFYFILLFFSIIIIILLLVLIYLKFCRKCMEGVHGIDIWNVGFPWMHDH